MSYTKTNWQNTPSTQTPISAANLNHMEQGIYDATSTAESAQSGVDGLDPRMDLVEQRLDNLIPQGTPTEGNAELIDIRVGANGVTYPDAGSAVRGQVSELKSALNDCQLTTDLSGVTVTDEYYIYKNGTVSNSYNFAYTSSIPLLRGQTIVNHGKGSAGNVCMIAKVNQDSTYTSLVNDDNSGSIKDYEYTATEDMYVALSYNRTVDHSIKVYYKAQTNDTEIIGQVNTIKSDLAELNLISPVSFSGETRGTYINKNGVVDTSYPMGYIDGVALGAGDKIVFNAKGSSTSVAMIAINNGVGNNYTDVAQSIDSNVREYSYTADFPCTVALSYNWSATHEAKIIKNVKSSYQSLFGYGSMFYKMSVIGDSLASGELVMEGGTQDVYGDSWLSYIAKMIGAKRNHYSEGGLNCKTWLEDYLTKMQSDEASNVYFIALGTNDNYSQPYDIGDITDVAGTNSFVGYYKQIIEAVRTKAPNSVIFCVSLYNNQASHYTYSDMISDIADLYDNCFYVDYIGRAKIFTSSNGVWARSGHFTTMGYRYVASLIYQLVNEIVDTNRDFFKWYGKYNSNLTKYDF